LRTGGEIATRIVRACRDLGITRWPSTRRRIGCRSTSRLCDYAVPIGPAPARESYLVGAKILEAAKKTGATLVHPGYGFLAENAAFAQTVIDSGLTWVGPSPASISAMGSKTASERGCSPPACPSCRG